MGDRRMVEIRTKEGSLYLYTHLGGYAMPERVMRAIGTAKPRWDDAPYAMHILVDQITTPDRDSEIGTGIMLKPTAEDQYNDNNPSIIIDLVAQTLWIINGSKKNVRSFDEIGIEGGLK